MLDSLDYRITAEGIEIGVYGKAAPRADGHNNLSGDSELPLRQFLPNVGESFVGRIDSEVDKIITDARAEDAEPPYEELGGVERPSELYDIIGRELQLDTQSEIRAAVNRNPKWFYALEKLGLLKWL